MIRKVLEERILTSADGEVVGTLYVYEALDEDQIEAINAHLPDAQIGVSTVFLPSGTRMTGRPRR